MKLEKGSQNDKVLKALQRAKKPINYEEIANRCNLDKIQVARRLSELANKGLIVEHGTVSMTKNNRPALNWIIAA